MSSHEKWDSKFQIKEGVWVFVPNEKTVSTGLQIKELIEDAWSAPGHYFHLQKGGHVSALKVHLHNQYFIHLDIQNFFGQINRSRISRCLKEHVSYVKARDIAFESTVRLPDAVPTKFILPFGFVQSPIIASICLSKSALGRHLATLSKSKSFAVSVYMDDILVSCNDINELTKQLDLLKKYSERSLLPLNTEKQQGPDVAVTAFNISISKGLLEITDDKFKEFSAKYAASTNEHQRAGILNYVWSVNPNQATKI
jgi:hypothetical protein